MTILYLYEEIMPYNLPIWRVMKGEGYNLKIIQIDKKKLTPFKYDGEEGITVFNLSKWTKFNNFWEDIYNKDIKLLYMSDTRCLWYWRFCYRVRKKLNVPIVCGSDAQWMGTRNNYLKKMLFPFSYQKVFSHMQSAGLWQVDYARRIGFKREQIITPLYCANNDIYYTVDIDKKKVDYPKRFLFVGRLNEVKGIRELLQAWDMIADKKGWVLTLVGNGPMEDELKRKNDIEVMPFLQQEEICKLMQNSGCALVPSRIEPWGLVIHEAVAAALPIIVSRNCGATNQFVINGYNGLLIKEKNVKSLYSAMMFIINSDSQKLLRMSYRSREMAKSITPEHVAYSILSLLDNSK